MCHEPFPCPPAAVFDRSHGRLKLASSGGQGWQVITVPGTWQQDEVVGWGCSLVLDEQGQPHIAYLNLSSGLPEISRRRPDGSWISEVVQLEPVAEPGDWQQLDDNVRPLQLLLDQRQVEWLAFWDPRDGGIKVASRQQPGWGPYPPARLHPRLHQSLRAAPNPTSRCRCRAWVVEKHRSPESQMGRYAPKNRDTLQGRCIWTRICTDWHR